jgi:flagellar basal body-associated protein FliL
MAEKEAKKADAPAAAGAAPAKGDEKKAAGESKGGKGGGLLSKTPVMLGGVMILEALVLFAGFKFVMGATPKAASADVLTAEAPAGDGHGASGEHDGGGEHGKTTGESKPGDKKKQVEIPVVEFRAPNKQSGRTFIYDVAIYAMTKGENESTVKEKIKSREALIKDRIRTIIAQSDPEKLEGGTEPNLDTLRRQVKVQLDDIIGDGVVDEVLVPRCIPFRTDY